MPLEIVRDDITHMQVDAVVNAANHTLLGGGGVDGAIHLAAGPELLHECETLGGCETGDAKITGGYSLPAKYVIHTVGPVWKDGKHGEEALLRSCYRKSLELAANNCCETVAFPLISSGIYGYPKDQALNVAVSEIASFLMSHEMHVFVVVFDKGAYSVSKNLFIGVKSYIDENYVADHTDLERRGNRCPELFSIAKAKKKEQKSDVLSEMALECDSGFEPHTAANAGIPGSLAGAIGELDESFSQALLRLIDERGMTDVQCYKKANIDRKLFSKIRSDRFYKPKKATAIAFAIALELSLSETEELLRKAGYALSHSVMFDVIIEYFIKKGRYDVFEINEVLFAYDQSLLGA